MPGGDLPPRPSNSLLLLPAARHVFSIVSGFLLVYYPFATGVFHAIVPTSLAYFFMRRFRQHCGTLTWLTAFPYLIVWWAACIGCCPDCCRPCCLQAAQDAAAAAAAARELLSQFLLWSGGSVCSHVLQASGAAWKEGQLDFTGAQVTHPCGGLVGVRTCQRRAAWSEAAELGLKECSNRGVVCARKGCVPLTAAAAGHRSVQMVLTLKVIAIAMCYQDALKKPEVGRGSSGHGCWRALVKSCTCLGAATPAGGKAVTCRPPDGLVR